MRTVSLPAACLCVWLTVVLWLSGTCCLPAQMSEGRQPLSQEQIIQNNIRMLVAARSNQQSKPQILDRMRQRLTQRGMTDVETRLTAISAILDEAVAMSETDFANKQQQLALRVMEQARPSNAAPSAIPWVDVHDHLAARGQEEFKGAATAAVESMNQAGASKMIIMPPPQDIAHFDCDSFRAALQQHPGRFAFLGGGGSLNVMIQQTANQTSVSDSVRRQFEQKAEEILRQGASGFGEIAIHHLSLHGAQHPYECVAADHPLLLLLADIAARHDVPIDVHFDVITQDLPRPGWLTSPNNPAVFHPNLAAFERLLDHNPRAKICWAHAGSDNTGHWTAELSHQLLQKHANLYMSLRPGPGNSSEISVQHFPMNQDGTIKAEWLKVFQDFPDRFVIGSDQFTSSPNSRNSGGLPSSLAAKKPLGGGRVGAILKALPPDVARKIAAENAITLYRLN
ncbi:MAG: amidohydrolase family protein [Verrucomicrobiae bacterium]|nr:amidohydrolase family protein [Verrucomicrobiae bacterium]